eukprot:6016342-Ditylum_brightwellii.AAC.1
MSKDPYELDTLDKSEQAMSSAAVSGALHSMVVPNFWTVWNEASSGNVVHVLFVAWNQLTRAGPAV